MRLLHHLARTGGTLISRCLASMEGVCLLSEINPLGTKHFNPRTQAHQWHGLLRSDESSSIADTDDFQASMLLIQERAAARGQHLIVRDWSHLDWIGFPFVETPKLATSWDGANAPEATVRCATVRHPLDQYLSCKRLAALNSCWDDAKYWRGTRMFAESIQSFPWSRYEDFLQAPEIILKAICESLDVPYDDSWKSKWSRYVKMTGDAIDHGRSTIKFEARKPVASRG